MWFWFVLLGVLIIDIVLFVLYKYLKKKIDKKNEELESDVNQNEDSLSNS